MDDIRHFVDGIVAALRSGTVAGDAADIDADPAQIGKAGSPTNVKAVQNIVFKAKESRTMNSSDEEIDTLIQELLNEKIIG